MIVALAALAFVVAAVAVGWYSVDQLEAQSSEAGGADSLSAAYGVARNAGLLVSASAVRTNLNMNDDSLAHIADTVEHHSDALDEQLALLESSVQNARTSRVRDHVESLVSTAQLIEDGRPELLRRIQEGDADLRQFRYGFSKVLEAAMINSIDDQIHHLLTAYDESGRPIQAGADPIGREILRLYHMANLNSTQGTAIIRLRGAAVLPFAHMIPSIQEDYESEVQRIEISAQYLADNGTPNLNSEVIPLLQQLVSYGEGEQNIWNKTDIKLRMSAAEAGRIAAKESILEDLVVELDAIVEDANDSAAGASTDLADTVSTLRIILIVIAVVGILGTLIATWYFGSRRRPEGSQA